MRYPLLDQEVARGGSLSNPPRVIHANPLLRRSHPINFTIVYITTNVQYTICMYVCMQNRLCRTSRRARAIFHSRHLPSTRYNKWIQLVALRTPVVWGPLTVLYIRQNIEYANQEMSPRHSSTCYILHILYHARINFFTHFFLLSCNFQGKTKSSQVNLLLGYCT